MSRRVIIEPLSRCIDDIAAKSPLLVTTAWLFVGSALLGYIATIWLFHWAITFGFGIGGFAEAVEIVTKLATVLATIIGGIWALRVFSINSRTKAAELLLQLEGEYADRHQETFLEIENTQSYNSAFREAIKKAIVAHLVGDIEEFCEGENRAITKLESALRHMLTACFIRRRDVDEGLLDESYGYYLELIRDPEDRRPELSRYIQYFWPSIFVWAVTRNSPPQSRPEVERNLLRDLQQQHKKRIEDRRTLHGLPDNEKMARRDALVADEQERWKSLRRKLVLGKL